MWFSINNPIKIVKILDSRKEFGSRIHLIVTMVASKVDDVSRLSQDVNDISGERTGQANIAEDGIQAINGRCDAGVIIEEFKTPAEGGDH